jgi:hypothetical protein
MIRIDDSLLEELGLIALPKADRDQLLKQIYETLEMKVGMRLAERMSDQQLDEFERFIDTSDEAGALKWLETNFPDYKQVVADELEKLKLEIKRDSPKIMEAMQANPTQPSVQSATAQANIQQTQPPQPFPQPQPTIAGAPEPTTPPQPNTNPAPEPWSPPPSQSGYQQPPQFPSAPEYPNQENSQPGPTTPPTV